MTVARPAVASSTIHAAAWGASAAPRAAGTSHIASSASCSSSAERTSGVTSASAAAIAAASSAVDTSAMAWTSGPRPRRKVTAWVRRSSSGASSRNAYGLARAAARATERRARRCRGLRICDPPLLVGAPSAQ
jgi:hypothetical protein